MLCELGRTLKGSADTKCNRASQAGSASFRKNDSGNMGMVFALAMLPTVAVVGMATDYGRAYLVKAQLNRALDACSLMGGRSFDSANQMSTAMAEASTASTACFQKYLPKNLQASIKEVKTDALGTVTMTATSNVKANFMPLLGVNAIKVSSMAKSIAASGGGKDVELSLVMDVTGSMNQNSKLITAKLAAKDLLDILMPATGNGARSVRVSIVPFSEYVNAGTFAPAATGVSGSTAATYACTRDTEVCVPDPAHCLEWTGYDADGYDHDGYDDDGYDRTGYDDNGFDHDGYDHDGYDDEGYDRSGHDRSGRGRGHGGHGGHGGGGGHGGHGGWGGWGHNAAGAGAGARLASGGGSGSGVDCGQGNNYMNSGHANPACGGGSAGGGGTGGGSGGISCSRFATACHTETVAATCTRTTFLTSCMAERMSTTGHAYDDAPPSTQLFHAFMTSSAASTNCPAPAVALTPLTSNKADLTAAIDSLVPAGGTAGHIGTAWGWYTVSAAWADFWPAASAPKPRDDATLLKAVVIMTDGDYNVHYASNYSQVAEGGASANGLSRDQAAQLCTNMKAAGVEVFTVGVELGNQTAKNMLAACASSPSAAISVHYYDVASAVSSTFGLRFAFRSIGGKVATLAGIGTSKVRLTN